MTRPPHIVIADDDRSVRLVLAHALKRQDYHVTTVSSIAGLWDAVVKGKARTDMLITDIGFPDGDILDVLPRVQAKMPNLTIPDLKIIVMSARTHMLTAIKTQQHDVHAYFPKPFELKPLLESVRLALSSDRDAIKHPRPAPPKVNQISMPKTLPPALMGQSPSMQMAFRLLTSLAPQTGPLLLKAEAGSGKLSIAKILHEIGGFSAFPFHAIDLAQMPPRQHKKTLLKLLSGGGFIFINHIDSLSASAQKHLVFFLEKAQPPHAFRTLYRLIFGTSVNLNSLVTSGAFREDLALILGTLVSIPPLRDRIQDIPQLVRHFCTQLYKHELCIDQDAFLALQTHHWPYNVREMETIMTQIFAQAPSRKKPPKNPLRIRADMIHALLAAPASHELHHELHNEPPHEPPHEHSLAELVERRVHRYFGSMGEGLADTGLYIRILAEIEKPLILATLHHTSGNQIKAAQILGLNRNTLRKKIKELNISPLRADYKTLPKHQ